MPQTPKTKKELVFTIEYSIFIDENMEVDVQGVIEKAQETGLARITGVEIR
jgi:hypothetical protein